MSYRFRLEGELLVLQVGTCTKSRYDYEGQTTWRDATVSDIPVRDPFARDPFPPVRLDGPDVGMLIE